MMGIMQTDPILMGSKSSKSNSWQPGTPGMPRKYSAAGYDITPLTKEEKEQAAAGLSSQTKSALLSLLYSGTIAVFVCVMCCCEAQTLGLPNLPLGATTLNNITEISHYNSCVICNRI